METGIDTIQLRLYSLEITENANVLVKTSDFNPTTGECTHEDRTLFHIKGRAVKGVRAYSNENDIQFDIKYFPKIEYPVSFVKFSVPKTYSDGANNVTGVSPEKTVEVLQKVECKLSENGIFTDLTKATISRLDLFRNITLKYDLANYRSIMTALSASRKRRRDFGGFGFLWENTVEEFNTYDKKAEQESKGNELPEHLRDLNNLTRFEHRMFKSRTIQRRFNVDHLKVQDIIKKYNKFEEVYKNGFGNSVFKVKPNEIHFNPVEHLPAIIDYIKAKHPKRWMYYLKMHLGYVGMTQLVPDKAKLIEMFKDKSENRMQFHRVKREVDKVLDAGKDWPKYKTKEVKELYSELKRKVTK